MRGYVRRCRLIFSRLCCCFRLPRLSSGCSVDSVFEYIFPVVDFLIRRVLGRFLFVLLYGLLLFILLVTLTIVIPYESLHKPPWVLALLVLLALYLYTNIFFHFHKACSEKPGSPLKSNKEPQCYRCQNHKPANAHHCSICNICVLNMDHHCVWINQCVGANNHRYFFQFVTFVSVGCLTFVLAAYNTFYYNYWHGFTNRMFCDSDRLAVQLPWFPLLCSGGPHFVVACVFFTYLLCSIVSVLVGGLAYWNFVLISNGETYLGVLLMTSASCKRVGRLLLFPHRNPRFREHWRAFLGLERGKRTLWRHILLPSSHTTEYATNAALGNEQLPLLGNNNQPSQVHIGMNAAKWDNNGSTEGSNSPLLGSKSADAMLV